ncbi:DnaJ-domain-containing protein [Serendipita vermifera]|nr:DnaJ-domain-containing protein [Serendipita vermifera]
MSKRSTSTSKPAENDEIDRLLNREATALSRDAEVDRILAAFKLNPYDILDVEPSASAEDVKKRYKQISLLIHPDKATHPKAQDAFDLLKKAESELSDKEKRENLDATVNQARVELLKSLNLPATTSNDHVKLKELSPPWKSQLKDKVKAMLIDEELRRRRAVKLAMANEGREAQQKEEEVASRKRKAEEEKAWEENREERVGSWRSFASGGSNKKRKKNKIEILG